MSPQLEQLLAVIREKGESLARRHKIVSEAEGVLQEHMTAYNAESVELYKLRGMAHKLFGDEHLPATLVDAFKWQ